MHPVIQFETIQYDYDYDYEHEHAHENNKCELKLPS